MVGTVTLLLDNQSSIESARESSPEIAEQLKTTPTKIIDENIHPLMHRLEERFKAILSAETPSFQMENERARD